MAAPCFTPDPNVLRHFDSGNSICSFKYKLCLVHLHDLKLLISVSAAPRPEVTHVLWCAGHTGCHIPLTCAFSRNS